MFLQDKNAPSACVLAANCGGSLKGLLIFMFK